MGKYKQWSPTDDHYLITYVNQNMLWQDIAKELGVNVWQAQRRAKVLNIGHKNPLLFRSLSLTITIPEKLDNAITKASRAEGISKSFYVRKLLEKHLHVTYSS